MPTTTPDPDEAEFARHRDLADKWIDRANAALAQPASLTAAAIAQTHATMALAYATRAATSIADHWSAQMEAQLAELGTAVDNLAGAVDDKT